MHRTRLRLSPSALTLTGVLRASVLSLALLMGSDAWSQTPANTARILLTNAQQMAALSNNVPPGRYEARFEAVVHYVSPPTRRLYVQDGNLGVQINLTNSVAPYRVGNLILVTGLVSGGDPALHVTNANATILRDVPLPTAPMTTVHNLVRGDEPFRYVRVRGTVRDMYSTRSQLILLLTHGNYPFEVWFQTTNAPLPRAWLDADLVVSGHSYPFYNPATGRPSAIRFHATSTNNVRVMRSGVADRFDGRPLLSIAEVTKLTNDLGPRYRVAGTVTFHRPGSVLYIEDGTGVLQVEQSMRFLNAPAGAERIEREPQTRLTPGERVEVIGARFNFFSIAPTLQATEFRRIGRGEPIKPIEVSVEDLREGRYAGRLVTTTARVIDQRIWGTSSLRHNMTMLLRDEDDVFQANWDGDAPVEWSVHTDNYVRITGVNEAERGPNSKRSTFKLLVRSPEDVSPAPAPPYWTRREFQRIAFATGGVAALAGVWILLQLWQVRRLERRVADRTAELARVAAQARASEAHTRSVVDTALDAVISMDAEGRITAWNSRAEAIFGWRKDEVLGRSLADTIIPPEFRERHRRGLEKYLATGEGPALNQRVEVKALRRDGTEFPAELSIAPLQIDGAPHFSAFLRDITDRKLAETRLRESEERFSKAFHGSNARLAILDADEGRYLDVNDAFVQAYGYSREEALGRTSAELGLWVNPAQRDEAYQIYQQHGRLRDFESRLRTRSGEEQVVLQSGDFVNMGDRRCILSVSIDITDRKRAEAELLQNYAREKELNELKSRFVAMVSHEFRTPLAIITSSAEILDAYLERLSPEDRKSNLHDITDATRQMSRMMEEVLLLSRVEAGKMTCKPAPLDLAVFCQRLVDEVTSATNSRCAIQFSSLAGLSEARADEGLLRHIFTNLLSNASKYSPAGSPVEFELEAREHLAVFTVRDRGIGIPEADARLLYQAFHRGRNVGDTPGTGLGMSIVKRCVELHGGKIGFQSREGEGTAFTVALPLFGAAAANGESVTQLITRTAHGKNLTVIS